jgi:hypothetical protein
MKSNKEYTYTGGDLGQMLSQVCGLLGVSSQILTVDAWQAAFMAACVEGKTAKDVAGELSGITEAIEAPARKARETFETVCGIVGMSPDDANDDSQTRAAIVAGIRAGKDAETIAKDVSGIAAGAVARLSAPVNVPGMFRAAVRVK